MNQKVPASGLPIHPSSLIPHPSSVVHRFAPIRKIRYSYRAPTLFASGGKYSVLQPQIIPYCFVFAFLNRYFKSPVAQPNSSDRPRPRYPGSVRLTIDSNRSASARAKTRTRFADWIQQYDRWNALPLQS